MKRTALFQVQLEAGANFVDFGGWELPVRFSNELAEHAAVRSDCGLFDVSHMGQLRIAGSEAAAALDFALVTEPSAQQPGQAKYSMICNSSAGLIDDLIVYRIAADEYLIVANASNAVAVLSALQERFANFDAAAQPVTPARSLLALQGPNSETVLAKLGITLNELGYYRIQTVAHSGVDLWIARTGYTGEDGFEISVPSDYASTLWVELISAGATQCGLAARDTLRLEAGMPLYGHELTAELSPFDVGMARVVKLNKQQPQFAQAALGAAAGRAHLNLVGLVGDGKRAARAGYQVFAAGASVGEVTSGALSPSLGYPIAMAIVSIELEPGATVSVDIRGQQQEFRVVKLPFYKREKK
jgi:aminomethyltransferase